MATIRQTMSALGCEPPCDGCGKAWERGEIMHGIEWADGDPAGWYCTECVQRWQETGDPRRKEAGDADQSDELGEDGG